MTLLTSMYSTASWWDSTGKKQSPCPIYCVNTGSGQGTRMRLARSLRLRVTWLKIIELIMVIELSGGQFGLKSYAWFQNRTSAQREFDLKSQVLSFQTKIALHKVLNYHYYSHFDIAEFSQYLYFIYQVAGLLKKREKKAFTSHFVIEIEMMRNRAKVVRFKWCDLEHDWRRLEHVIWSKK